VAVAASFGPDNVGEHHRLRSGSVSRGVWTRRGVLEVQGAPRNKADAAAVDTTPIITPMTRRMRFIGRYSAVFRELRSAISVERAWRGLSPSRAVGAWSLAARQEARKPILQLFRA
jgi:hypothetical protein